MKFPERSESRSKHILKMKPEESITGIFRGDIYTFRQHWENKKAFPCLEINCPRCDAGQKSSFRFQLNFIFKENAVLVSKIFEQGWTVMEQLEELNKDYPLEMTLVKITRKGNGTDTTYTILPAKDFLVKPAQEKEIAKVQLHVLEPAAAVGAKQAASAVDMPDDDEGEEVAFPA